MLKVYELYTLRKSRTFTGSSVVALGKPLKCQKGFEVEPKYKYKLRTLIYATNP